MDPKLEIRNCLLRRRTFPNGSLLCNAQECIQCSDGNWVENWPLPLWIKEVYAVPGEDFSEV